MHNLLLSLILSLSVADHLDGAEIGDAVQYVAFQSGGKYVAERKEKGVVSRALGTWKVDGNELEVKVASCKGPACKELGASYTSDINLVADRAMTVRSTPEAAPLSSGSYYCHYQGCEKRTGVELVTRGGKPGVMRYLVDFLIDKNRSRDVTVVWWGKKADQPTPVTKIAYCGRSAVKAKAGAELVAKDLSELSWLGLSKDAPDKSDSKDCLYDVRVTVGEGVVLPTNH